MVICDVVQWRRVRRKVLVEDKPIELVAMQESLTVEATKEILTQRPKYRTDDNPRLALFSSVIPFTGLAAGDRQLLQWSQWLYSLERDELAFPPFGDELSRHGAAARKRLLAVLATEEGSRSRRSPSISESHSTPSVAAGCSTSRVASKH